MTGPIRTNQEKVPNMSKKHPYIRHRLFMLPMTLGILVGLLAACAARAGCADDEVKARTGAATTTPETRLKLCGDLQPGEVPATEAPAEAPREHNVYAMLCMANAYPRLRSEKLINNVFDPIMGAVAPGMAPINTFGDMRDNHLLWMPNIGGGYNVSRHLSLFLQLGYGSGPVRTKDSALSVLLLPLHMFFEMNRSAFTITPGLDYFPFGMVEQRDYHGLKDRLCAIRPMFGVRVPWTHAGYKARANLGLGPLDTIASMKLGDSWSVWSTNLNIGFDVPVNRNNQVNVNLGRSYFFGHDSDFGGPVFSVTWKLLF